MFSFVIGPTPSVKKTAANQIMYVFLIDEVN